MARKVLVDIKMTKMTNCGETEEAMKEMKHIDHRIMKTETRAW
jgi:hypothetical protein